MTASEIEVAVSSAQVTGAIGTLILLLLGLIGWLVRSEWQSVNTRLGIIESNTSDLPALKARVERLEEEMLTIRKRQHMIANFVNRLLGKLDKGGSATETLDLEKED